VACILIRNVDEHVDTFSTSPDYLAHMPRGLAAGNKAWFGDLGVQLTRGFRALKVWMSIKAYGLDKFTEQIEKNVHQAKHLISKLESNPVMEVLADAPLNIVCFRYIHADMDAESLNKLNMEILFRLHERGLAVPSYTRLNGDFALRVSITNHRSTFADLDYLLEQVESIAGEVLEEQVFIRS
jgi:glutamate/tyrosine decarboxylase-like PLP-dependent enzyme